MNFIIDMLSGINPAGGGRIIPMRPIRPTAYARFISSLDSLDRISPSTKLDGVEEQLLNYIYLARVRGEKLLVGDIILLGKLGSQATLHGRLKNLVSKGFVQLIDDKVDGRRKSVHITAKAEKHYERLSAFMTKAVKL